VRHVIVYREPGRFAGWPANGGMWARGNEIVVGFRLGYMHLDGGFHAIDRSRPSSWAQARSLDGGETWSLEEPRLQQPADGTPDARASGLESPLEFSRPGFALKLSHDGLAAGARSWFHFSDDLGTTWQGPCWFPSLGLPGIAARTDYMPLQDGSYLFFLTAAKRNGAEGHAFCARTTDGARTFEFRSWIGPEPAGWTIMPASQRLPDGRILVALRCRDGNPDSKTASHWIDLYLSTDEGQSWEYSGTPVRDTGVGGNPPTLNLLADGRLVITYGYRRAPFGMRAAVSTDQGSTWDTDIVLRADAGNHDIGYPRTLVRPDGQLVTVYYYNDAPEGERYIAATIWTP